MRFLPLFVIFFSLLVLLPSFGSSVQLGMDIISPCPPFFWKEIPQGECKWSQNSRFRVCMQESGVWNVQSQVDGRMLFESKVDGDVSRAARPLKLELRKDGTFGVFDSAGETFWTAGIAKMGGVMAQITNDGEFVVWAMDGRTRVWSSKSGLEPTAIRTNFIEFCPPLIVPGSAGARRPSPFGRWEAEQSEGELDDALEGEKKQETQTPTETPAPAPESPAPETPAPETPAQVEEKPQDSDVAKAASELDSEIDEEAEEEQYEETEEEAGEEETSEAEVDDAAEQAEVPDSEDSQPNEEADEEVGEEEAEAEVDDAEVDSALSNARRMHRERRNRVHVRVNVQP